MKQRHANGQLLPLRQRMTKVELAKRDEKKEYRLGIQMEHAKTRGMVIGCMMVLRRGFFGRLKWLFFGR